jgi:hypothetical protein
MMLELDTEEAGAVQNEVQKIVIGPDKRNKSDT